MSIRVIKPGLQTTIQSRPRTGLRHQGVPAGGAADALSLALANKLVGNRWDAPALEITLLGPTLQFFAACRVALTGATIAASLGGRPVALHETLPVSHGDELVLGAVAAGVRSYLAVAGGFAADDVLGSTATNLQARFGGFRGRALQAGDELTVDTAGAAALQTPPEFRLPMPSSWALRACAGPEFPLLDEAGAVALFDTNWIVGRRADRMGLRLQGPKLAVASEGRMPSAAVFPGAVQCPEDGAPYLLSVDAGTVGGYPRIAQVARLDRHLLGQLGPGHHVRLLRREPDDAVAELRSKVDYWRPWLPDAEEILR